MQRLFRLFLENENGSSWEAGVKSEFWSSDGKTREEKIQDWYWILQGDAEAECFGCQ